MRGPAPFLEINQPTEIACSGLSLGAKNFYMSGPLTAGEEGRNCCSRTTCTEGRRRGKQV